MRGGNCALVKLCDHLCACVGRACGRLCISENVKTCDRQCACVGPACGKLCISEVV